MLKQRAFLLLALCCAVPAQAGLFSDDEARLQVKALDARIEARLLKLESVAEQQTRSMLDLQSQIEALNAELRKLRGQSEELARGLQDAEKREKDFYVDLDTRLRVLESAAVVEQSAAIVEPTISSDPNDPVQENRSYETAYGIFRKGDHAGAVKALQEFIDQYPASVHVPNATFWLGNAKFAAKSYEEALETYRNLRKSFPTYARDAEVMFNIAGCQFELKQNATAEKSLRLLISKYPDSDAAAKAKKLLANIK